MKQDIAAVVAELVAASDAQSKLLCAVAAHSAHALQIADAFNDSLNHLADADHSLTAVDDATIGRRAKAGAALLRELADAIDRRARKR